MKKKKRSYMDNVILGSKTVGRKLKKLS